MNIQLLLENMQHNAHHLGHGNADLIRALMDMKFIWTSYPKGMTEQIEKYKEFSSLLRFTFKQGNVSQVRFLLDTLKANNINVNAQDDQGRTPLETLLTWYPIPPIQKDKITFLCQHIEQYRLDFNFQIPKSFS